VSALAASWLTSGWWDVLGIVGWMATVVAIGVVVWTRSGRRQRRATRPERRRGGGRMAELIGAVLALMAIGTTVRATLRRRAAR
jgi:hypothetical protein